MIDRHTPARFALLSGLALLASGCAETRSTRYPSLLPRPIESRSDAEPVVAPVAAAPDPALDQQVAAITQTVAATNKDFTVAAAKAEALAKAAQGDAVGGERWINAQSALAELDGYQATTSSALTDLEEVGIARAADGKPDYPALVAARDATQATINAQAATIARLQASLPSA